MKRYCMIVVLSVWMIMLNLGCSKTAEPQTVWTFANHAGQTVYIFEISPNGHPDSLELASDTTMDVTITGDKLDYDFGPADAIVRQRDEHSNVITFYDKE